MADLYVQHRYGIPHLDPKALYLRIGDEYEVKERLSRFAHVLGTDDGLPINGFASAERALKDLPGWDPTQRGIYEQEFLQQYQDARQERLRRRSLDADFNGHLEGHGMSGLASQLRDLDNKARNRRKTTFDFYYDPGSKPSQAALDAVDKDMGRQRLDLLQNGDKQIGKIGIFYEEWGRHQDIVGWRSLDEIPDQVRWEAESLGMPEKDILYWLEHFRLSDWRKPMPQRQFRDPVTHAMGGGLAKLTGYEVLPDQSRVLPDGTLRINPTLHGDKDAYEKAVAESIASPAAKQAAREQFPHLQEQWAATILPVLEREAALPPGASIAGELYSATTETTPNLTFNQWRESRIVLGRPDESGDAFLRLSPEQQVLRYVAEMKSRPGFVKYVDTITRSGLKGVSDIGSSALGFAGLFLGRVPVIGEPITEGAAEWSRQNARLTNAMEYKGGTDTVGLRTTGLVAALIPQVAATVATAGTLGGSTWVLATIAGSQAAGAQFAETYAVRRDQGMPHEATWNSVAPYALATGIVAAATTALGGKTGVDSLLGQASPTALRQALQPVWKSFFKGALKENAEELPEELFSQISAALAKDPNADITKLIGSFIESAPELMVAVGLLGGTGQMSQTAPTSATPPPVPQTPTTTDPATAAPTTNGPATPATPTTPSQPQDQTITPATPPLPPETPEQAAAREAHQAGYDAEKPPQQRFEELQRHFPHLPPKQMAHLEVVAHNFDPQQKLSLVTTARQRLGLPDPARPEGLPSETPRGSDSPLDQQPPKPGSSVLDQQLRLPEETGLAIADLDTFSEGWSGSQSRSAEGSADLNGHPSSLGSGDPHGSRFPGEDETHVAAYWKEYYDTVANRPNDIRPIVDHLRTQKIHVEESKDGAACAEIRDKGGRLLGHKITYGAKTRKWEFLEEYGHYRMRSDWKLAEIKALKKQLEKGVRKPNGGMYHRTEPRKAAEEIIIKQHLLDNASSLTEAERVLLRKQIEQLTRHGLRYGY